MNIGTSIYDIPTLPGQQRIESDADILYYSAELLKQYLLAADRRGRLDGEATMSELRAAFQQRARVSQSGFESALLEGLIAKASASGNATLDVNATITKLDGISQQNSPFRAVIDSEPESIMDAYGTHRRAMQQPTYHSTPYYYSPRSYNYGYAYQSDSFDTQRADRPYYYRADATDRMESNLPGSYLRARQNDAYGYNSRYSPESYNSYNGSFPPSQSAPYRAYVQHNARDYF